LERGMSGDAHAKDTIQFLERVSGIGGAGLEGTVVRVGS
jgi:hypothetical protein